MNLVKSKQRVADHGEVFTPAWMVGAMLELVKANLETLNKHCIHQGLAQPVQPGNKP